MSVNPPSLSDRHETKELMLFAANGTSIKTFGQKILDVDLGLNRRYKWPFLIADVRRPIIGYDFLQNFGLLVDPKHSRLIDPANKQYHWRIFL